MFYICLIKYLIMEVILKKTKLTKSVVEQSLWGNHKFYLGQHGYEVLGWCRTKLGKYMREYILLYCKSQNTVVKLEYLKNYEVTEKNEQTVKEGTHNEYYFPLVYRLKLGTVDITATQDKQTVEADKEKLRIFLREVEQKGQIYI
jgi:hypothetical protein